MIFLPSPYQSRAHDCRAEDKRKRRRGSEMARYAYEVYPCDKGMDVCQPCWSYHSEKSPRAIFSDALQRRGKP